MSRRTRARARRLGLDVTGLDKRQQRRAVRRAATRRATTLVLTFRGLHGRSAVEKVQAVVDGLVDGGYITTPAGAASKLRHALNQPVVEPLHTSGPREAIDGTIVEPTYANALRLGSECLFSKFGFGDGDEPEPWLDYCDDHGISYPRRDEWNRVLRKLVRERLVPQLPAHVEVYDIDTIHNPIRASRVDGRQVRWDHNQAENSHYWPEVEVWVSWPAVAAELELVRQ